MKVPYAENAAGIISALYESTQPNTLISTNTGIIVTEPGIIMVARYAKKIFSLPGNLSLEKEYAARALVPTCAKVTAPQTNRLFR
jgi:hypothetical protein